MTEVWESSFIEGKMMWGLEPADSAISTKDFFLKKKVKDILIPGIGYGRNAKIFVENGINVTGIEISKTAIDLAKENGLNIDIFHGSVTDMPFDNKLYDGIYCYALIHLLNEEEREKFIKDCYDQLKPGGYMIFITVSKQSSMYRQGRQLDKDYFEITEGINMFFYDSESVKQEFGNYGLLECTAIPEPCENTRGRSALKFITVICQKKM